MQAHTNPSSAAGAVRRVLGAQRGPLLALVRRRGGSKVDAEDVLQAGLQRALERANQLKDPERAEAWVARVVRNVLTDELRKHRDTGLPADTIAAAAANAKEPDCWCVLVQAEQLKPEYAAILRRVIVDGVAVTQVATELGLSANNATVRLHRARKALKQQLAAHCGMTTMGSCADCGCEERGCCPHP